MQSYRMLNIGIAVKCGISERGAATSFFTRRMGWITHCCTVVDLKMCPGIPVQSLVELLRTQRRPPTPSFARRFS
uniref:Uncharacterized protein n=1 Tax=mine drainage metagenome TaxID=410659 RepID=E6QBL1_9ZZZZ